MGLMWWKLMYVLTFFSSVLTDESLLAREVTPSHYSILWAIDECEFSGRVEIDIDIKNSTDHFELHAGNLEVERNSIKIEKLASEKGGIFLNDVKVEERLETESACEVHKNPNKGKKLTLSANEPLKVGSKYRLSMAFKGTMNSKMTSGFFCQRYTENNQKKWLASTSLEPKFARTAFPCFDEPGLKANFTISIAHHKNLTAISNMPINTSVPSNLAENWILDTFQTTPKMSTYLIGIHVSEFDKIETEMNKKKIRLWANPKHIKYGNLSLKRTAEVLSFLENYTGIEDPIPKHDFIAIEDYVVGGLEKWGIVSYNTDILTEGKDEISEFKMDTLIGHELAHTYFGNLVSIDYWRDLWLKEGFASYFETIPFEKVYPVLIQRYWINNREMVMRKDIHYGHPLRTKNHLECFYDHISYQKGSLILRMLNFTLGEAVFKEGIRNYLKRNSFSLASHESLWEELEDAALKAGVTFPDDVNLEEIMESWVNAPGYPLVNVTRNYELGEITLTQRSMSEDDTTWFIPLSYTYEGANGTVSWLWLDPRQPNLTIKDLVPSDKWILFNLQGSTFARVHYDEENVELLKLKLSDLSATDRAIMLSDIWALGLGPMSLNAVSLLKNETSPLPWAAFSISASRMLSYLEGTGLDPVYKEFLKRMLSDIPETVVSPQMMYLACKVGAQNCSAMKTFDQWKDDFKNFEDMRYVLCYGISKGDANTWKMVYERLNNVDENKKMEILYALACTEDSNILEEYLDYILRTNEISENAKILAIKSMAELHTDFIIDYFIEKKALLNRIWEMFLDELATQVNSPERLDKFQQLIEMHSPLREKTNPLMEMAKKNVAWMIKNQNESETWMMNYIKA